MDIFGVWAPMVFMLFYLSAIVIASVPDYYRHKDFMAYNSLGASGATSAVLMGYIFLALGIGLSFLLYLLLF